jgi:hypothetical protein
VVKIKELARPENGTPFAPIAAIAKAKFIDLREKIYGRSRHKTPGR